MFKGIRPKSDFCLIMLTHGEFVEKNPLYLLQFFKIIDRLVL